MKSAPPGARWRILANGDRTNARIDLRSKDYDGSTKPRTVLDEVVIDHWLHVEQMDRSVWWMQVGEMRIWVTVSADGKAKRITVEELGSDPKPRTP